MGLFDGTIFERPILCDRCGKEVKVCGCPPVDTLPEKQTLSIRLEKRKKGKFVTVVSGFDCSETQLRETLSALQSQCGSGGCVAEMNIELQGDHVAKLSKLLTARGYRIKK
jgi:translation initiation factor 1